MNRSLCSSHPWIYISPKSSWAALWDWTTTATPLERERERKGRPCPFIQFKKSTASMWRLTCILWEFLRRLFSVSVSKAPDGRAARGVEHYGMSRSEAQGGRFPRMPVCMWGVDDSWEWETFAWATEQLWGGDPATVRPLTSCQPVTSTNRAHQSGLELIYKALEH